MITGKFAHMDFPIDPSEDGLMSIFKDWAPDHLKTNFLKWCEIGLNEIVSTPYNLDSFLKIV